MSCERDSDPGAARCSARAVVPSGYDSGRPLDYDAAHDRPVVGPRLPPAADVVVVGGGAVGVSAAYHLAAAGAGSGASSSSARRARDRLDRAAAPAGSGTSSRAAVNVELSLASIPLITGFSATHGLPLDVVQDGYLFLVRDDGVVVGVRGRRRDAARARRATSSCSTRTEAGRARPGARRSDGVVGATYCARDGIADPSGLTLGYATAARRAGAEIRTGVAVTRILTCDGDGWSGSRPTPGRIAGAGRGRRRRAVGRPPRRDRRDRPAARADPAGRPRHRRRSPASRPAGRSSSMRPRSFYFHREGERGPDGDGRPGRAADASRPGSTSGSSPRSSCRPRSASSRPLAEAAIAHSWVGLYEMTPDRHPILGPVPGLRRAPPGQRVQRARLPARPDRREAPRRDRRRGRGPDGRHLVARPRPVRRRPAVGEGHVV